MLAMSEGTYKTISGLPRLSGEYNKGYTRAIQDLIEIFNYIQPDLKHYHKNITAKTSISLLECCLKNRANLRDKIGDGFIRYNGVKQEFEYFIPKGKRGIGNDH